MSSIVKTNALESEAIYILREVIAQFEKPVLLFSGGKGFPDQVGQAAKSFSLPPKNQQVAFTISDLAPGTYALAVIHDQDSNGKLSSNAVGYPVEKFGFSNNPKVYFSPPSFEKAAFPLGKTPIKVTISLR